MITVTAWGYNRAKENQRLDAIKPVVFSIPMGHVTSVNQCRSSKHSYDCVVSLSSGQTWNTDITDKSNSFFAPGNPLHWEIWTQEYRQEQYICDQRHCYWQHRFVKGDEQYSETFAKGNRDGNTVKF